MHTALECEVTIKPRFVYIPSPRTGPVRGGAWESRDGWGGRAAGLGLAPGPPGWGASVRSCYSRWRRAGERRVGLGPAECAAGGRGDPRPSACGPAGRAAPVEGCPGFPRPPYGDPGPEAGPRGSSAGGNGRQPLSSSGPTEKARWGAREPWRSPWVPEPGRGATMARPRALFPGTGVQGGVGAVGRGGKWPARRGVLIRSPPRSSLGGGGGLRNSPAWRGVGCRDVEGLPAASEKTRPRGSLSTWAEFEELGTWKKSHRRTPRRRFGRVLHPSVCSK